MLCIKLFIGFSTKAFDRVKYDKLFNLLVTRKINPLYIRLLCSMYHNQKLKVSYNGVTSRCFSVSNEVKQGGVLSPTLFGEYVDGMLEKLKECMYGCKVGSKFCGDLFLLTPTIFALKNTINICEEYADQFDIKFNGCKSKVIVFSMKGLGIIPEIYVKGELLPCVNEIVYLGHVIKNDRSDTLVESVVRDFNSKFNSCMADFGCKSSVVKNKLFQQ